MTAATAASPRAPPEFYFARPYGWAFFMPPKGGDTYAHQQKEPFVLHGGAI